MFPHRIRHNYIMIYQLRCGTYFALPYIGTAQIDKPVLVFSSILFYHAVEDFKITGRDADQLKTDVVAKGVERVNFTPLTTSDKYHERLAGYFAGQVQAEANFFV